MAYSTQDDMLQQLDETSLIRLTDDAEDGVIDAEVVTRSIADADATIDAYCQGRYTVPLTPVPDKIRGVSVDIAVYNLYSRKGDTAPEIRKDRHKEAIRFLEKVSEGKIKLGALTPASVNTADSVQAEGNDRIFTRTKMGGF